MKKWTSRFVLAVLVAVIALGLVPAARAQEGEQYIIFYDAKWVLDTCDPIIGNSVLFTYAFNVPAGYWVKESFSIHSELWVAVENSVEYTSPGVSGEGYLYGVSVPPDGSTTFTVEIYTPDHTFLTSTSATADCVSGFIMTPYGDVFGINQPTARAMGTVLADTVLFSEPSPDYAREEVLKAGQTWFVVGQTTGTDGNLWYKVFVGGFKPAYVPAAVLSVSGEVPGAE